MADGIRTDHDPPKPRHLDADGRDTRELAKIKPRPDHPKRRWRPEHLAAGYHLQDWQSVTADHECLGRYAFDDGAFTVTYRDEGDTGAPDYWIEYDAGGGQNALDHSIVEDYIQQHNATRKGAPQ